MPEVDGALASHCLDPENLGTVHVQCKIVKELSAVRTPTDACEGWSIRDRLFDFLEQACQEWKKKVKKGKMKDAGRILKLEGQIEALGYAIAMMDSPYRPDPTAVIASARMEASNNE